MSGLTPAELAAAEQWVAETIEFRQQFLDRLSSGELSLEEAFERADADERLATLKVVVFVESCKGRSKVATRRGLTALGIDEGYPVGSLTAAQRLDVAAIPAQIQQR